MKALLLALLFVPAGCRAEEPAKSKPHFPALTGRVVDQADLLTPADEQELARKSEALEREVGPQYAVVTVPTLQGYPIEDYGVKLGNYWGVGSKERNDGLLLIVAPNERKVRVEVGYGLERRVTDPYAAKVIREQILPRFKEGAYADGIKSGSDALIARLRSKASDAAIAKEDHLVP